MDRYSGEPCEPYPELDRAGGADAMIIDLGGSHRVGYPDLWISAQGKVPNRKAQVELLAALHRVRETRPQDRFFLYCDAYGRPNNGLWYLMRSQDGVCFVALTYAKGWEDIVCEIEILIEHHDHSPGDDPTAKGVARLMDYMPLDG